MHGHHEPSTLRRRYLSLVDGNTSDKSSDPQAVDKATSHEHAVVDRSCAYRSTNDEDYRGNLNCSLAAESVCGPRADGSTDGGACAIDAVEGTNVLSGAAVARFAVGSKVQGRVEAWLADGGAREVSRCLMHHVCSGAPNNGHAIGASR